MYNYLIELPVKGYNGTSGHGIFSLPGDSSWLKTLGLQHFAGIPVIFYLIDIMSLICVGSMAYDAIETPFGKRDKIVGGAAVYAAYAAANFIKPINLVSIIGNDFEESEIKRFLDEKAFKLLDKLRTEHVIKEVRSRVPKPKFLYPSTLLLVIEDATTTILVCFGGLCFELSGY